MVLLEDFGSIVVALEYGAVIENSLTCSPFSMTLGRLVYDNLKKTSLYLLPAGR